MFPQTLDSSLQSHRQANGYLHVHLAECPFKIWSITGPWGEKFFKKSDKLPQLLSIESASVGVKNYKFESEAQHRSTSYQTVSGSVALWDMLALCSDKEDDISGAAASIVFYFYCTWVAGRVLL